MATRRRQGVAALAVLAAVALGLVAAGETDRGKLLREGEEIVGAACRLGGETHFALATPLARSAKYEARVSYLSTTPAGFFFSLHDAASGKETSLGDAQRDPGPRDELRRRRLNTERFHVHTDDQGRVISGESDATVLHSPVLTVRVEAEGILAPGATRDDVVTFNIALDPLYAGVIPGRALGMIAWGIICVGLALRFLTPYVQGLLAVPLPASHGNEEDTKTRRA